MIIFYPITIMGNMLLIYIIWTERSLHKSMYILIANLSCISLYGGFVFTPSILFNLFTGNYQLSRVFCLMQVFNVHTYGGCEITNLMVMAYDRYLSICFPFIYEKTMTPTKLMLIIALIWLIPFGRCCICISLTAGLTLCGRIIEKVYCDNLSLVRLACSDISDLNVFSTINIFLSVIAPFFIIIYSYVRIIFVCLNLTKSGQTKVLRTCVPHLVAICSFLIGCSFELYQNKFDMSFLPYSLRVVLSLYFLIVGPAINPVIYGARTEKISSAIKKNIFWLKNYF